MSQNLQRVLKSHLKGLKRLAILGVGSDLRADDVIGVMIAQALQKKRARSRNKNKWQSFLGYTAPENLTGEIKAFKPSHLIIVDTINIGALPGTVVVLESKEVSEKSFFSTHKLPIKVMIEYLRRESRTISIVVGIQPKSIEFGKRVSKEAKKVSKEVIDALAALV